MNNFFMFFSTVFCTVLLVVLSLMLYISVKLLKLTHKLEKK